MALCPKGHQHKHSHVGMGEAAGDGIDSFGWPKKNSEPLEGTVQYGPVGLNLHFVKFAKFGKLFSQLS